jgi:hypothetical protein
LELGNELIPEEAGKVGVIGACHQWIETAIETIHEGLSGEAGFRRWAQTIGRGSRAQTVQAREKRRGLRHLALGRFANAPALDPFVNGAVAGFGRGNWFGHNALAVIPEEAQCLKFRIHPGPRIGGVSEVGLESVRAGGSGQPVYATISPAIDGR